MEELVLEDNKIKLVASKTASPKSLVNFDIINKDSNQVIYQIYTQNENFIDGVLKVDIVSKEENDFKEEYFKNAINMFCKFIFNSFPVNKIQYETYENNFNLINMLEITGFEIEANLKEDSYIDGKYISKIILSIFRK